MLSNCGAGEDSGESLGLRGGPASPSQRKSTLNTHWKDWLWSGSSHTLVTWFKKPALFGEDSDAGHVWEQEEKRMTEGEMVRQHQWLNGHESEKSQRGGKGQGSLVRCSLRVTERRAQLSDWITATYQLAFLPTSNTDGLWTGNVLEGCRGHAGLRASYKPRLNKGLETMGRHSAGTTGAGTQGRKPLVDAPVLQADPNPPSILFPFLSPVHPHGTLWGLKTLGNKTLARWAR